MTKVTIEINRDALPEHTTAQFETWLKYRVIHNGWSAISPDNPLYAETLVGDRAREQMTTRGGTS